MSRGVINVGLAIFARNEAERIGQLISDLGEQTLLADDGVSIHIFVVANGCTDRTADVARQALATPVFSRPRIGASVQELAKAGKSNAWNELVHRIAPKGTDYMFFLDADIRIPDSGSLKAVLDGLVSSPEAVVAVDRSVKDIELEQPKTLTEKLIKLGTGTADDTRLAIAGACYCVRFSEVERIWMPIGLPGEDGFLRAMLLTSSFAHEERLSRHLFVGNAYHIFESMRDAGSVVRHNVRLAIGTAINILLFWHLRELRASGRDLAEYIQERNSADPDWVDGLIRERLKDNFFPLHTRYLLRRFRPLVRSPERRSFRDWLIALFGASFDLVVFLKATFLMRKGAGAGYW
jgi:glycosyltransferase involved in cell wall biosynthesis